VTKVTPTIRPEVPAAGAESSLSQLSEATHADVKRLIDVSLNGEPLAADPRPSLRASDAAVAAISAHLAVMEVTVYPEMKRYLHDRQAEARLRALRRSARELTSIARGIEQLVYGDQHRPAESLPALQAQLSALIAAHAEEEEALVAELEERMPPAAQRQLGDAVERERRHAPTRPHPHLLYRTSLGARLVVHLAGRWDHLLDTLDARTAAGAPVTPPPTPGLWGWYLLGRPVAPTPTDGPSTPNPPASG
jgi:hypothetical protein